MGIMMYIITKDGKFVVEDYNWKTSFSNFFPGIAGKYGIPMWAYYVTRNQCLISLGVRDKNHQIMEFLSFNKALELVDEVLKEAGPRLLLEFVGAHLLQATRRLLRRQPSVDVGLLSFYYFLYQQAMPCQLCHSFISGL